MRYFIKNPGVDFCLHTFTSGKQRERPSPAEPSLIVVSLPVFPGPTQVHSKLRSDRVVRQVCVENVYVPCYTDSVSPCPWHTDKREGSAACVYLCGTQPAQWYSAWRLEKHERPFVDFPVLGF